MSLVTTYFIDDSYNLSEGLYLIKSLALEKNILFVFPVCIRNPDGIKSASECWVNVRSQGIAAGPGIGSFHLQSFYDLPERFVVLIFDDKYFLEQMSKTTG